ncbi:MAG TPA: hypothetical protein VF092_16450 [Longimicrobium sp.]
MKKLRLDPEKLVVEPFQTQGADDENGTVVANDATRFCFDTTPEASCGYPATCGGTSCDSGYPVCYQCSGQTCDSGYPVCYECTAQCTA